jgi:hypothetical protein
VVPEVAGWNLGCQNWQGKVSGQSVSYSILRNLLLHAEMLTSSIVHCLLLKILPFGRPLVMAIRRE